MRDLELSEYFPYVSPEEYWQGVVEEIADTMSAAGSWSDITKSVAAILKQLIEDHGGHCR